MEVEIVLGDLRVLAVEAVVNPANSRGEVGGGVAGALRRAGGEEIEREAVAAAIVSAVRSFRGRRLEKVVLCGIAPEMVEAFRRAWDPARA